MVPAIPQIAFAQAVPGDTFADGKDGSKVHTASGFVCPAKIGLFERDAVGESDPQAHVDFCAYSALDGVYGTITIAPADPSYDPRQSLARDFAEQEATGGKQIAEEHQALRGPGAAASILVYVRTYESAKLEDLHYRVLFAGAEMKGWAVESTIEFAEPRDVQVEQQFLNAIYAAAQSEIAPK